MWLIDAFGHESITKYLLNAVRRAILVKYYEYGPATKCSLCLNIASRYKICGENKRIFTKILSHCRCIFGHESDNKYPESESGPHSPRRKSTLSHCSCLFLLTSALFFLKKRSFQFPVGPVFLVHEPPYRWFRYLKSSANFDTMLCQVWLSKA